MRNRNSVWQEGFFWPAVALCLPQAPSRISLFLLLSFLYCFGLRFGHFLRWHPLTDVIDAPLRGKISSRCLPTLLCHEQLEHCLQPSIPRFTLAQEPFHKFFCLPWLHQEEGFGVSLAAWNTHQALGTLTTESRTKSAAAVRFQSALMVCIN